MKTRTPKAKSPTSKPKPAQSADSFPVWRGGIARIIDDNRIDSGRLLAVYVKLSDYAWDVRGLEFRVNERHLATALRAGPKTLAHLADLKLITLRTDSAGAPWVRVIWPEQPPLAEGEAPLVDPPAVTSDPEASAAQPDQP